MEFGGSDVGDGQVSMKLPPFGAYEPDPRVPCQPVTNKPGFP